ncbi:MAG: tryptophan synthase subunit alpha [Candidatus Omnitrophica bacterium]|nr:tryptophan synthase subunit alpha [Candidatus Omnitrophota bacterium]
MKNRLLQKIRDVQKEKGKLFCAFITLGYPDLKSTEQLILEFEKLGVDIIELGIPFSDPLADGPTIQFSSEFALRQGVSLLDAFHLVSNLRLRGCKIPILCFSYLNPIYHFGIKAFPQKARQSGFDGLIIPDLPPEEEKNLQKECRRHEISQVFLVAPTTRPERASQIARSSSGFVYYVSLRGVTGARQVSASNLSREFNKVQKVIKQPLLIGFGISSPEQGRALSRLAQGVIVGSAIIDAIRSSNHQIAPAILFVEKMLRAVKERTRAVSSRN